MEALRRHYDFFKNSADPRVENWPLMSNPTAALVVVALYLYAVYGYLPKHMKDRKPYNLKKIIQAYNMIQVICCSFIIHGVLTSGWTTHYTLGCQPVDYSNDPMALRMLGFVWFNFVLKLVDLVDTVFFLLRKKNEQVSTLHVYHHASTFFMGYISCKYVGGGMTSFTILVNSFIHVLMYTYYFLSTLGPNVAKKLAPWKRRLTTLQIVQFMMIIAHSVQAFKESCEYPSTIMVIYVPDLVILLTMFSKFYTQNYTKTAKTGKVKL